MPRASEAFRQALQASPSGTRAVVIDVGANDGRWSRSWAGEKVLAASGGRELQLYMIEPQIVFHEVLTMLASKHNFTFLSAAAAKAEGELVLYTKTGASMSASTVTSSVRNDARRQYQVHALDLAVYLRNVIPPGGLALLKMDVEGLEYDLLPWLLLQGSLCRLTHLIFEWHLVAQPIGSRLEALALRHSIGGLLRSGCSSPPEVVEHEEFAANNFAFPVPGLQELAAMHTRWANSASGGVSIEVDTR